MDSTPTPARGFNRTRAEAVASYLCNNVDPLGPNAERPVVLPHTVWSEEHGTETTHYELYVADGQTLCEVPATMPGSDGQDGRAWAEAIADAGPLLVAAMREIDGIRARLLAVEQERDATDAALQRAYDEAHVLAGDSPEERERHMEGHRILFRLGFRELIAERDAYAADLTRERQERTRWQVEAGEARQLVAALIDIVSQAAGQPSRIRRVKAYREATRCGLKEALDAVAALDEKHPPGSALDSLLGGLRDVPEALAEAIERGAHLLEKR